MSDIEGAICDNCGAIIGPGGCCATHAARADELEQLQAERDELKQERAVWVCVLRGARAELEDALDIEGDDESLITERIRTVIDDLTRLIGDGPAQSGSLGASGGC